MHALPHVASVLILAPVLAGLLRSPAGAFPSTPDAPAMRMMIVALWFGVAACSATALTLGPRAFWPILLFQVVYKAAFLVLYARPILARAPDVPWGPVAVFVPIVALWPFFVSAAIRG